MSDKPEETKAPAADETEYAVVELMGHRTRVGRVMEVERFGAKMLRIDVPKEGDFEKGFVSQFYSGTAIYCFTPCDLATVERHGRPYAPASRLAYREPEDIASALHAEDEARDQEEEDDEEQSEGIDDA